MLGAALPLEFRQDAVGVDFVLEAFEEGGAGGRGQLARIVFRVEGVGSKPGA